MTPPVPELVRFGREVCGDPPHTPRGAPAQAWSVACVLEAWWRLEKAEREAAPSRREAWGGQPRIRVTTP